jgi:hypothetical protein
MVRLIHRSLGLFCLAFGFSAFEINGLQALNPTV